MEYVKNLWRSGSIMGIDDGVLKWLREYVRGNGITAEIDSYETCNSWAVGIPGCADGLFFIPHIQGERSPYYDNRLSGAFV